MNRIAENFFDLEVMARYLPSIIDGAFVTIHLAVLIVLSGLALGFVLAVIRAFQIRPVNWLIVLVVDVFRALPPIVIMIVFYFALPFVGISMSGFVVAWLSLTLVLASFAEEIFWTGILSVDRGQWEAARSTGLGFLQTLRDVVLPQAVRLTIPPLTNRTIVITQEHGHRIGGRGAGDPHPGKRRAGLLGQHDPPHDGRGRLPRHLSAPRRPQPVGGVALRVEALTLAPFSPDGSPRPTTSSTSRSCSRSIRFSSRASG